MASGFSNTRALVVIRSKASITIHGKPTLSAPDSVCSSQERAVECQGRSLFTAYSKRLTSTRIIFVAPAWQRSPGLPNIRPNLKPYSNRFHVLLSQAMPVSGDKAEILVYPIGQAPEAKPR